MAKHWSDNDFLMATYGVGPEDGHLEACAACRAEFERRQHLRRQTAETAQVPADFLVEQRRRIDARVERPKHGWMFRWSPALGATAMAVALVVWQAPLQKQAPAADQPVAQAAAGAKSDAQLFAEIYQTASDWEPESVTPVKALFEAKQ
ncbi:MAG: hypothetical protein JNK87_03320 [Bryobacterales bacterium]|nr:hypothetical protein [Bryobacterales bacterium]